MIYFIVPHSCIWSFNRKSFLVEVNIVNQIKIAGNDYVQCTMYIVVYVIIIIII